MKKGTIKNTDGVILAHFSSIEANPIFNLIRVRIPMTVVEKSSDKDGNNYQNRTRFDIREEPVKSWEEAETFIRSNFNEDVVIEENS
jgi:hypothetical protein